MNEERIAELTAEAKRLGADRALTMASWLPPMGENSARSILDDVDPEIMDSVTWPSLSGEMADDPTPDGLYDNLGMTDDEVEALRRDQMLTDIICGAWEDEASEVFGEALQAHALRLLGHVHRAVQIERELEKRAARL